MENQSNEVISNMVLTRLLKRWGEIKTQLHPSSIAMNPTEHIHLKVCCIVLKYCHIQANFPLNSCMSLISSPIFQTVESNPSIIINKDPLYVI